MAKRAVLRLDGELEQGFQVTLEIGAVESPFFIEATGTLPPAVELAAELDSWRSLYRQLSHPTRINLQQITVRMGPLNQLDTCRRAAAALQHHLQIWLASPSFHSIDRQLRESLSIDEPVQVLLRSPDRRLHSLPWHLWDFFEHYSQAELALSSPPGQISPKKSTDSATVNVLAILGDRQGIDTAADQQFLDRLPQSNVVFLVEPSRQQITNHLWEQHWDILFFAGHSQREGNQGRIYINPQDSLTIEELKYGLKTAIANGLQLALFNSCDGLGLAYELEQLHIPQLIVMREPVPDPVAQDFLKHFLTLFANGQSLYQSIRTARERLQGLEGYYPCATWLPILYQNPAAVPPTWQGLQVSSPLPAPSSPRRSRLAALVPAPHALLPLLLTSFVATGFVLGIRYLGWLQSLELATFDQLLQLRPNEPPDPRLLVILVTDEDVQAQPQAQRRGSLSDSTLAQLLQKLETYQPKIIGLDIYRDYSVDQTVPQLSRWLQRRDRLVAVCKVGDHANNETGVAPPPELPATAIGFSDIVFDADNIVRRHLLAMTPAPSSRCVAPYAFSVQLALRYLESKGVTLKYANSDTWQLGSVSFRPLQNHSGGYQLIDDRGHQILLNYRAPRSPDGGIRQITLGQFLSGQINQAAIRDRIVLIGTIAEGTHDYWLTPYYTPQGNKQAIPGVILQAQMTSQLLSAVLDGRPLLWNWPRWAEILWIAVWAILGGWLSLSLRKSVSWGIMILGAIAVLFSSCLLLLIQTSAWVPLFPAALALIMNGIGVSVIEEQRRTHHSRF